MPNPGWKCAGLKPVISLSFVVSLDVLIKKNCRLVTIKLYLNNLNYQCN